MKVVCYLRLARGERTLKEVSQLSGVSQPELSRIEHGRLLPADEQIEGIERAYQLKIGDAYDWRGPMLPVQMDNHKKGAA